MPDCEFCQTPIDGEDAECCSERMLMNATKAHRRYNKRLTARIRRLEKDLRDALDFAAVPIRRCPNCKRIAMVKGWVCQNCGYDPSYSLEEFRKSAKISR